MARAATIDEPGVVSHQAPARISIGPRPGVDEQRLAAVHAVLATTGQVVQLSSDRPHLLNRMI
jgi:ketopantoate reductase